eukprot:1195724-Prorocentrum_minimum.AAC.3
MVDSGGRGGRVPRGRGGRGRSPPEVYRHYNTATLHRWDREDRRPKYPTTAAGGGFRSVTREENVVKL